jgi:hypothetical protein
MNLLTIRNNFSSSAEKLGTNQSGVDGHVKGHVYPAFVIRIHSQFWQLLDFWVCNELIPEGKGHDLVALRSALIGKSEFGRVGISQFSPVAILRMRRLSRLAS